MIAAFEAREGFNLIIMSPIAAGVGLTVVGANHAVHLERHWNPAKEAQASDRIYRIGQKKDAHIYIPILHHPQSDSFDVNLHKLLSKKTLLKDAVVTVEQVLPEMPERDVEINKRIEASDLSKLSWQQFEALCAELFIKSLSANSCWLTELNDKGADVVLQKSGKASLIQCKHTRNNGYQGYKAVQEITAAKPVYESLLKCEVENLFFVTNAKRISVEAKKVASASNVTVYTYAEVSELLERHSVSLGDVLKCLEKSRLASS
jgi:HJR/Mrr/RecB family endonuclease